MEATVSLGPPIGLIISGYTGKPADLSLRPPQPPYTVRRAQLTTGSNLVIRAPQLLLTGHNEPRAPGRMTSTQRYANTSFRDFPRSGSPDRVFIWSRCEVHPLTLPPCPPTPARSRFGIAAWRCCFAAVLLTARFEG